MQIMIAGFDLAVVLAAVTLAVVLPYLAYRVARGVRVYLTYREGRLVTCPETQRPAVVTLDAAPMALQAIVDEPCMRLKECSRWPMRQDCGQDCLRQLEPRSSAVRFCAAVRA